MATLTVTLPENTHICNGKMITFRAPCDCTGITGIIVEGIAYTLVDTTNTCISEADNIFSSGSMISVTLDTVNNRAYIMNAINYSNIVTKSLIIFSETEPKDAPEGTIWFKPRD